MNKNKKKIIFLIGAGFSKPLGMPLASELFSEILNFINNYQISTSGWAEDPKKFKEDLVVFAKDFVNVDILSQQSVDFEKFLSDIHSHLQMRDHWKGKLIDRYPVKVPSYDVELIEKKLLRFMTLYFDSKCKEVWNSSANNFQTLLDFSRFFGKEEHFECQFITLNYDILLERGLFQSCGGANRDSDLIGPRVIKLHGSIDVWDLKGARPYEINSFQEITIKDKTYYRPKYYQDFTASSDMGMALSLEEYPQIVPPTFFKRYEEPYIEKQVQDALNAICGADTVCSLGLSFNNYDFHLMTILRFASFRRKENPLRWIIVDPNAKDISKKLQSSCAIETNPENLWTGSWIDWFKNLHAEDLI